MDTEKRFGLKKYKAILLFVQMILIVLLLIVSIYLLIFMISYNLGPWMITSYVFITISVISIICYSIIGYKKGELVYKISVIPFSFAVFVNILLPGRQTLQIASLTILFTLLFAFLLKQNDKKYASIVGLLMIAASLTFSIYSSFTADISFLGETPNRVMTYVAMYVSIFIPVVMSVTIFLIFNVRYDKLERTI